MLLAKNAKKSRAAIALLLTVLLALSMLSALGCNTGGAAQDEDSLSGSADGGVAVTATAFDQSDFDSKGYTITASPVRLERERFILEVPAGVYVPATVEQDIATILDTIEETTGMSFFENVTTADPIVFTVITGEPEGDTGRIPQSASAYALGDYGVCISPLDLVVAAGQGWVMTHELLHVLNQRQGGSLLAQPLSEGFTTYWTQRIIEAKRYPCVLGSYSNYCNETLNNSLDRSTAEELFLACDQDSWGAYLYGFRLMHYMVESGYTQRHIELCREHSGNQGMVCAQAAPILKEAFGDDFFVEFGKWFEENSEMFRDMSFGQDFTAFDTFDMYPIIAAWDMYENLNFSYKNRMTLDFGKGNAYATEYLGRGLTGRLSVTMSAEGNSTATFLDADGNELKKVSLNSSDSIVTVENAVKIVITGDGRNVRFAPVFEEIVGPTA